MQHTPCPDHGNPAIPTEPPAVSYRDAANTYYDAAWDSENKEFFHKSLAIAIDYHIRALALAFDATHSFSERD